MENVKYPSAKKRRSIYYMCTIENQNQSKNSWKRGEATSPNRETRPVQHISKTTEITYIKSESTKTALKNGRFRNNSRSGDRAI